MGQPMNTPVILSLDSIVAMLSMAAASGTVKKYDKHGVYLARPAVPGETVKTVVDGVEETTNVAGDKAQLVVVGPAGEKYIVGADKFASKYVIADGTPDVDGYRKYTAVGSVFAAEYSGPAIQFDAPWGKPVIVNDHDYLATAAIGSKDVYRIQRGVFEKTYKPAA